VQLYQLLQVRYQYPDKQAEIVSFCTAAVIALLAYLFAGIFLHMAYERYFYMLMVICSAVAQVGQAQLRQLRPTTALARLQP
jgi:hypothetical protein